VIFSCARRKWPSQIWPPCPRFVGKSKSWPRPAPAGHTEARLSPSPRPASTKPLQVARELHPRFERGRAVLTVGPTGGQPTSTPPESLRLVRREKGTSFFVQRRTRPSEMLITRAAPGVGREMRPAEAATSPDTEQFWSLGASWSKCPWTSQGLTRSVAAATSAMLNKNPGATQTIRFFAVRTTATSPMGRRCAITGCVHEPSIGYPPRRVAPGFRPDPGSELLPARGEFQRKHQQFERELPLDPSRRKTQPGDASPPSSAGPRLSLRRGIQKFRCTPCPTPGLVEIRARQHKHRGADVRHLPSVANQPGRNSSHVRSPQPEAYKAGPFGQPRDRATRRRLRPGTLAPYRRRHGSPPRKKKKTKKAKSSNRVPIQRSHPRMVPCPGIRGTKRYEARRKSTTRP